MNEQVILDNRGLVAWAAKRYAGALAKDSAVEYEDLLQAGFMGVLRASETYSKQTTVSWAKWALMYIRREIHRLIGWRDGRFVKAHTGALSLDAPLGDETEELTGLDLLPDDGPPVDARVMVEADEKVIRDCVASLKDDRQRAVVERWKLGTESQAQVAKTLGVSSQAVSQLWKKARLALKRDQRLQALVYVDDMTPYYCRVTVSQFNTTNTSAVERAVLVRMRLGGDSGGPHPPPFEAS